MRVNVRIQVHGMPNFASALHYIRGVVPPILREEGEQTARHQRAAYVMQLQQRLRPWISRHGDLSWRMLRDIRATLTTHPDRWWLRVGVQSTDPTIRMIAVLKNRDRPTVIRAKWRKQLAIPLRALSLAGGLPRYAAVPLARVQFLLRFTRWSIYGRPRGTSGRAHEVKLFMRRPAVTFPNAPFIPQYRQDLSTHIVQRITAALARPRQHWGWGKQTIVP